MKYRIRKLFALTLALSMLLSMIPFGMAAESLDEFAGYETLDEIPFEFELEPGDLPFEQLKDATLAAEDIPYCIDPALAEARGHVNRLYLQEPDDCTVMFQNRDGSKTVYVFSHPVKGMTMTTTASIQVNGSVISFSGTNAISSRIAELSDYNIGYSEVAYIPTGILSADGIDLTEDARGWARGESMPSALAYNISSEAAAEYAASVSVPNTDVATAAVAPGVTITPNDPAPLGGMTVMSISYSDLAGLMSFKNTSTNKFLTLRPSPTYALLSSANIIVPLSRWIVSYDSGYGYTVTNLYQPANNYLGLDENNNVTVSSLNNAESAFTIQIVSTNDSKVVISVGNKAINSSLSVYSNDPSAASFPTSCEWIISSKTDCDLVEFIDPEETVRTENAGDIFYCEYTTVPTVPTYSDIEMYFASNDQTLPNDSDYDNSDSKAYYVSETGTYTVYYKDSCTGVRSANFTLKIVEYVTEITVPSSVRVEQKGVGFELDYTYDPPSSQYHSISLYYADDDTEVTHTGDTYAISTAGIYTVYYKDNVSGVTSEDFILIVTASAKNYGEKETYSITHAVYTSNSKPLYLSRHTTNGLMLSTKALIEELVDRGDPSEYPVLCEELADVSRTFTFKYANAAQNMEDGVYITATMSTRQYGETPSGSQINIEGYTYTGPYSVIDSDTVANTIQYNNDNNISLVAKNDGGTLFKLLDMGSYYLIVYDVTISNNTLAIRALRSNSTNTDVLIDYYDGSDAFKWNINQVGVDAPAIKQVNRVWCGPTSFLQVLYGMDVDVEGNNLSAEQTLIKNTWGMSNSAVTTNHYKNYMNGYKTGNDNNNMVSITRWLPTKYTCVEIANPSESELRTKIRSSLDAGAACIIFTVSGGKPYKSSYKIQPGSTLPDGHFICVIGYDEVSDTVILSNCHYSKFRFGIHEVDFTDFCEDVGRLFYFETSATP